MQSTQRPDQAITTKEERLKDIQNVTVIGAVANVLLSVLKVLAGWFGSSHALVADGIHSLSDLATDGIVLVAAKHGAEDADEEHPYGHGRIETLATVVLAAVLIMVALGIGYDAVRRLFDPDSLPQPGMLALIAAIVSVLAKEALYQYTVVVAKKHKSNLLRANAWHHRSDAISSVVVVIGVIGSMAGLVYLDGVASVVVAFMVAKIGWSIGWDSVHELVDRGLEEEKVAKIRAKIMEVDGVKAMHDLRTRLMGGNVFVDVDILVDATLTVSEGHRISAEVLKRLHREIDEVVDVTVHIDPEDDETGAASSSVPMRGEMLKRLRASWEKVAGADRVNDISLHYFAGKVRVEAYVSLDDIADLEEARSFADKMALTASDDEFVSEVAVLYK